MKNLATQLAMVIYRDKLYKETFWSALTKFTALFGYLALQIYLVRTLDRSLYGSWSFYLSLTAILVLIAQCGINGATNKFIAQHSNTAQAPSVITAGLLLRFFGTLFCCVLIALFFQPLLRSLDKTEFSSLLFLSLFYIFSSNFAEFFKSLFGGLHRLKYAFYVSVTEFLLKLVFTVILVERAATLSSVLLGHILAITAAAGIGVGVLLQNFPLSWTFSGVEQKYFKRIFRYSWPLFFASAGFLLSSELSTLMLGVFASSSEVAGFAVASQIVNKLHHVSIVVAAGSMPIFAKLHRDNARELKQKFFSLLRLNSYVHVVLCLGILIASPIAVPIIYGAEYRDSIGTLFLLLPYMFAFSYTVLLGVFLDYQSLVWKRVTLLTITVILHLLLNLLLIPLFGANGAALSSSLAYLPYIGGMYIEVKKRFHALAEESQ